MSINPANPTLIPNRLDPGLLGIRLSKSVICLYYLLRRIPNSPGSNLFGINVGLAGLIDICTQGCMVCIWEEVKVFSPYLSYSPWKNNHSIHTIQPCVHMSLFGINVGLAGLIDICTQGCMVCMEWLFFQGEYDSNPANPTLIPNRLDPGLLGIRLSKSVICLYYISRVCTD
jgi:hypothetical protein